MAKIIDISTFSSGELFIPNAVSRNASGADQKSKVELVLDKYERQLLVDAFGVEFYEELVSVIDDDELNDAGNELYKALVEGETYTALDGEKYRFDGLKGFAGDSFIGYYVFCMFVKNDDQTYTTAGTVRDTAKNATSVSATPMYVDKWQKFIKGYQGFGGADNTPKIIVNASGDYGLDYFAGTQHFRSLYQYMRDKNDLDSTNFPNIDKFKVYKQINSMNI